MTYLVAEYGEDLLLLAGASLVSGLGHLKINYNVLPRRIGHVQIRGSERPSEHAAAEAESTAPQVDISCEEDLNDSRGAPPHGEPARGVGTAGGQRAGEKAAEEGQGGERAKI